MEMDSLDAIGACMGNFIGKWEWVGKSGRDCGAGVG